MQWKKKQTQKVKQKSTKHYAETKDRATRAPLKMHHIVLIFFRCDIQYDHNNVSWFFDCVNITSTWYLQTLLI